MSTKPRCTMFPLSKTFRRENGFSTMVTMKTKARTRLYLEHDIRRALAELEPNIKQIVRNKQYQPSRPLILQLLVYCHKNSFVFSSWKLYINVFSRGIFANIQPDLWLIVSKRSGKAEMEYTFSFYIFSSRSRRCRRRK